MHKTDQAILDLLRAAREEHDNKEKLGRKSSELSKSAQLVSWISSRLFFN